MTDRIHALTVVLERDIRDDDIKALIDVIEHLRCVASVEPHVTDLCEHQARVRLERGLGSDLGHAVAALVDGKPLPADRKRW